MLVKVHTINAFAKTPEGGNPAGVVVRADHLSVNQMQKIAEIVGFSETAFVTKSNIADFEIRFFTPKSEVGLCGHATIGSFAVMRNLKIIKPGFYSQQTKAGLLGVEVRKNGTVMMTQAAPVFSKIIDRAEVEEALDLTAGTLWEDLPVQLVSTGLVDMIVPVAGIEQMDAIRPDSGKVLELSRRHKAVGLHLFTRETLTGADAYCRNLAPIVGIPEEFATGTASGALAAYLFRHGVVGAENDFVSLVFEQGYSMGRPSEILASLRVNAGEIDEVRVGGTAMDMRSVDVEV